jgi:hypothetical protein
MFTFVLSVLLLIQLLSVAVLVACANSPDENISPLSKALMYMGPITMLGACITSIIS